MYCLVVFAFKMYCLVALSHKESTPSGVLFCACREAKNPADHVS